MSYISLIDLLTEKKNPFPFNVSSVKHCRNINMDSPITFFIGDNGTGKSTLIETIAYRLQLPHMDGSDYSKKSFNASKSLLPYLKISFNIDRPIGFFFRAEDFGDYLNSVDRRDFALHQSLSDLEGEVPDEIIQNMKDNANYQMHHMRFEYGQELQSFPHGEAYMKIIQEKINRPGIYILDEPEAALSPAKQLSLIYFIQEHLKNYNSQFIIATHSPMLMAIPNSNIYEINEDGMQLTPLDETEHYSITKSFLNNPEIYLRHL